MTPKPDAGNDRGTRARVFLRKDVQPDTNNLIRTSNGDAAQDEKRVGAEYATGASKQLPLYNSDGHPVNHNGHKVTKGIQPDGESGRKWFHPLHFFRIIWTSSCTASQWTNILWPFTIAALVLYFHYPEKHLWIFVTAYIGMIPSANLVGFAGQELARKIPKVAGVLLETTFGSVVEIILFMVLLVESKGNNAGVIRAAILGSILANLLMCLGLCFFVGGIFHPQQTFHEAISEVGSNLMLVAALGLIIPTIYYQSLFTRYTATEDPTWGPLITREALKISRAAAIILLIAFVIYVWFQARSHHGLYEDILEADEERDHDRHRDLAKPKLTLTESILALLIALMFVSFMAVILVKQIEPIIEEHGISDAFMGLILIPLVEKASEHLTAIDEAYDNQMNFALSHILGASIQTALLNTPLVILVAWGLSAGNASYDQMALNFELFDAVVLILAIIVVGNFLRDEKSDYLEGALCVLVYALIASCAFYYPNPPHHGAETASASHGSHGGEGEAATEVATEAAHRLMMMLR